jgi:hypothetical protein
MSASSIEFRDITFFDGLDILGENLELWVENLDDGMSAKM